MKKSTKKNGKAKKVDPVNFAVPLQGKDRLAQLIVLAGQCNKALGKSGAVYLGKDQRPFERVPTGIASLDYVTGGGLVKGQLVQFTGEEGSFKTTAALLCAAKFQRREGTVVWLAGEGFDKRWAQRAGVDVDKLILVTADTGDTALEAAMTLVSSKLVDLMVFDSYQSLGTTREMDSSVEDETYAGGGAPQMWGRMMRKCYAAMNRGADTCLVGISQVRSPIGKFSPRGQPEPEGSQIWALKHWKAIDIRFKKGEMELDGDAANERRRMVSKQFKLRCIKNKTAESERVSSFDFRKKDGVWKVDNAGTCVRLAQAYELVKVKGAWLEGYGFRTQGAPKFELELRKNPKIQRKILKDIFALTA